MSNEVYIYSFDDDCYIHITDYKRLLLEIDRLNNIINELEKYIGQEWYCFDDESAEHHVAWHILMKLKELKEKEQ